MTRRSLASVDFETGGTMSRPEYPPKPVGMAYQLPGQRPQYMAWGHPCDGNNCSKEDAKRVYSQIRKDHDVVYHNAAFDTEVAERHLGLQAHAHRFHDTMFLAFLDDPRGDLALKDLASDHLGMPADEQTDLRDWILKNIPGATTRTWGAYIGQAPVKLVAPYAKGDVDRTMKLFRTLHPSVRSRGMEEAYERELALMPVVMDMEQEGIPIDVPRLEVDIARWQEYAEIVDARIRSVLDAPVAMNPGSGPQLMEYLLKRKLAKWPSTQTDANRHLFTKKGNPSTKYDVLLEVCTEPRMATLMKVRNMLASSINTFGQNWLDQAELTGGRVMPRFNQVRSFDDQSGARSGTRTGRFSSEKPNFQNITNPYDAEDEKNAALLLAMRKEIPGFVPPCLRDYVVPPPGHVLLNRDYSQQELRILAHYEDGVLLARYQEDPTLDCHELVRALVHEATGVLYPRKHIKITNFGIVYGMGVGKLAKRLGLDEAEARSLKKNVMRAIPGIRELSNDLSKMGRRGEFIRTWGGRLYDSEKPINGRRFEYKLLNVLIQGSAADCTKQGMLNAVNNMQDGRLMLQVHDELMAVAPKGAEVIEMKRMKEGMEDVSFDVPMLSDGKMSDQTWFQLEKAA